MAWLRIASWFEITVATNHIPKAFVFSWTHVILVALVTSLHLISNPSSGNHRQLLRPCTHQCSITHFIAWTHSLFILSIHHKITLVVSGKCQHLIETVTSLTAEGPHIGLRWIV